MADLLQFLESRKRMSCPHQCPPPLYKLMLKCWAKVPFQRPEFKEVISELTLILSKNTSQVEDLLSYTYFLLNIGL